MTTQQNGIAPLFELHSQVRFTHTDPAAYVFFPRYFEMLQAVIEEWFTQALDQKFADLIIHHRLGTPTATTQCTFMKPSRLGDVVTIAAKLEHIGNSSFRLRFFGSCDGEKRLEAVSTLVLISLNDGSPQRIPDDLRRKMQAYQAATSPNG
ncbi:MAG: acyl-CoA thioesterase [Alphaproteobacteria bacterium]|nr:acyl-CoA thioesterase [Alphaproteobacteria bacterium]